MNVENFKWWLHGWFEIEKPRYIEEDRFHEIKNHLKLVQKENPVINDNFINWFLGFTEANPELKNLNESQTRRVKDKLSVYFNKVTPKLNLFEETQFCAPHCNGILSLDSLSIKGNIC